MRLSLLAILLLAASLASAQTAAPRMVSAEPMNGKVGDVIAVSGENLQKDAVAKIFLTDGKTDIACEITEQNTTSIKFKIPVKASGRLALMILTADQEPRLIEQPVKVQVEEPGSAPPAQPLPPQ